MHVRDRRDPGFWFSSLVLVFASFVPAPTSAASQELVAAFIGEAWPGSAGLSAAGRPLVQPGAMYLMQPGAARPKRIEVRDTEPAKGLRLSPRLDRIAYLVTREVSCDPTYSVRVPFTVVADTTGDEIAALPWAVGSAWSPDGKRLAVVYGRESTGGFAPDSIGVIDLEARSGTAYPVRCRYVEWLDAETLLLEDPGLAALDIRSMTSKRVSRGGRFVSPDGRYSFSPSGGSASLTLRDDKKHADLTGKVAKLIDRGQLSASPFWVKREDTPHLLCVPVRFGPETGAVAGSQREPATYLIDAEGPNVTRVVPGTPVGSTPDGRAIVLLRDGELQWVEL